MGNWVVQMKGMVKGKWSVVHVNGCGRSMLSKLGDNSYFASTILSATTVVWH